MDLEQLRQISDKIQMVFCESDLNELGKELEFSRRERIITPFRLVMSLVESLACGKIETLADLHRNFNAFFEEKISYKAFYNQLSKEQFPQLMIAVTSLILTEMSMRVLQFPQSGPFSEFKQIVLQDGTSFSIKDALEHIFPGRFKHRNPSAVELHTTMDLLCDGAVAVVLSPDTDSERAYLPEPRLLKGCLLLADRGYLDLDYMQRIAQGGGAFVFRGKEGLNPWILDAYFENGKRPRRLRGKKLKQVVHQFPKNKGLDLEVGWKINGQPLVFRMIVSWNPQKKAFQFLITNLDPERYPIQRVCLAYRLRWQVELLFKEWKSYANLHSFDTRDPDIAEGLIWASIITAALKRFLAHGAQRAAKVEMSTRKAAMCAQHALHPIFHALRTGTLAGLRNALQKGIDYLSFNARRAHPKRDRKTGRSTLGLEPFFDGELLTDEAVAA